MSVNDSAYPAQRKVPFPTGIPSQSSSLYKEPLLLFGENEEVNKVLEKKLLHNIKRYKLPDTTNTSFDSTSTAASSTSLAPPTSTVSVGASASVSMGAGASASFDDTSLVSKMATRLASLEKLASQQNKMLSDKDAVIEGLKSKSAIHIQEVKQLQTERESLKRQIHEMETFLNDYGLVWVGGEDDDGSAASSDAAAAATDNDDDDPNYFVDEADAASRAVRSSPQSTRPDAIVYDDGVAAYGRPDLATTDDSFLIDMNRIRVSIAELNIIAGEGTASVVSTGNKMKSLQIQSSVPITFYKNGFMLFSGPFRPYSVKSSLPFLEDIMDGYFPYELKERFPDGVPFALTDRTTEEYKQLDRTSKPAKKGPNVHGFGSTESVNVETFLRRLPASTIKNGRVIDIRESIAKRIQGESPTTPNDNSNVVIVPTDVVQYLRGDKPSGTTHADHTTTHTDAHASKLYVDEGDVFAEQRKGRPQTPRNITTLKIKMEDESVLIIKLRFDDTIAVLRKYVDQFTKSSNYVIRTTFPNVVHSDNKVTLRAAGLVPNATVFIHQMKT